jgi:hypothetical protein
MGVRLPIMGVVTPSDYGALAFILLFLCFLGGLVGYACGCSDPSAPTVSPLCEKKSGEDRDDDGGRAAEEGAASVATKQPAPPSPQKNVGKRQAAALERHSSKTKFSPEKTKSEKFEASLDRKRSGNLSSADSFGNAGGKKGSTAAQKAMEHANKKKAAMEKARLIKQGLWEGEEESAGKKGPRFKDQGTHV